VISVAALTGGRGAAGYYLQRDAGCEHEHPHDALGYYVTEQDPPGHWLGHGAAALGLTGALGPAGAAVLRDLLDGRLGTTQLTRPVIRYAEDGSRVDVRCSGFDVTFSAPKSVSVLMGLGSPQVAEQVRAAHHAALTDAVDLLETLAARAARGHQGDGQRAPRIPTAGVIGAAFDHHTSRASDPQLHTHVLLLNLTCGVDGRWSALDSRTLHRQATTASHLYQHLLRAELTRRLGVSWTPVQRGIAEIDGIPLAVRRVFSTRRRQIEQHLTAHTPAALAAPAGQVRRRGRAAQLAARAACLLTRPAKQHQPEASLRARWARTAQQTGFSTADLQALLARRHAPEPVDVPGLIRRVLGPDGVTRERSSFDQGAVVREICTQLPAGADVSASQVLHLAARLVRHEQVLPVLNPDGPAFTTTELLHTEQHALDLVTRRRGAPVTVVPIAAAARAAARSGLRPDQQQLVLALLRSGRGIEVVTGPAGSGKTAALAVATMQWQQAGLPVAGTAVAALTAHGLQQTTGAASVSLARLLHHPEQHLPTGGVVLVDEAGMIGTRTLTRVLELTEQHHCKLVLVGDPAQLPELEAGGLFAALAQRPEALRLDGHHRQREAWEREALAALRCGQTDRALDAYQQHDRLHTAHSRTDLHTQAVECYLHARARADDPWQVTLLAARRSEVRQLNEHVRARLMATGHLGRAALQVDTERGPVEYRTGDQVLLTRNDHQRGLLNGTSAMVEDLSRDGLTLRTRDGRSVSVDRGWLEHGRLDHGYALTIHKAQGRTLHTALLIGDAALSTEAGYVGLSRGTHTNHLFLDTSTAAPNETDCPSNPRRQRPEVRERSALDSALRHSRQQDLATQLLREGHGR
jgi:conjugative relaxase-like TrwC/TraI family protein